MPGIALWLFFRKRIRAGIIYLVGTTALLSPWLIAVILNSGGPGGGYGTYDISLTSKILRALAVAFNYLFYKLPSFMLPILRGYFAEHQVPTIIAGCLFLFIIAAGVPLAWRDRRGKGMLLIMFALFVSYIPTTRALLRYLSVLSPFFLYAGYLGFRRILDSAQSGEKTRKIVTAAAAVIVLLLLLPPYIRDVRVYLKSRRVWVDDGADPTAIVPYYLSPWYYEYYTALKVIESELPEDALIVASKPHIAHFFTGRKAMEGDEFYRDLEDVDGYWRKMTEMGAGYVLFENRFKFSRNFLVDAVKQKRGIFTPIYKSEKSSILILKITDGRDPDSG